MLGQPRLHRGYAERAKAASCFSTRSATRRCRCRPSSCRLVETREFNRLGGEQLLQFHGRIVCSTNPDLEELIGEGHFREDLYYRINGMRIECRLCAAAATTFLGSWICFSSSSAATDRSIFAASARCAQELALEHDWPGNVRELRNRVERAVALARGDWIMPADMFPDLEDGGASGMTGAFATLSETRDFAERRQIERALKQTDGQIIEAAQLLGISRTTLWEKMKRLGIAVPTLSAAMFGFPDLRGAACPDCRTT